MDIDLVVPWVDGSDIEHIKLKHKYELLFENKLSNDVNGICRFKDSGELKYLFRSIEQNAKFIRYVFLVTNGQIPKWLDVKHPKIKIITHDQIMPKTALPTFSSNAIEACIVNIPGLSDSFLYANDDCFIAKPVNENFFFTKKGYPISRLRHIFSTKLNKYSDTYSRIILFTVGLFYKKFHKKLNLIEHHNIDAFYKPDVLECINLFKEYFDRTINCKFRDKRNVSKHIWSLYSFYVGHSKIKGYYFIRIILFIIPIFKRIKRLFKKQKLINTKNKNNIQSEKYSVFTRMVEFCYRLIQKSTSFANSSQYNIKGVKLFCCNDTERSNDEDRKRCIEFLNKLFSNKSSFEK